MKYIIFVKTINDKTFTYHVDDYKISNGRIIFYDKVTDKIKNFDSSNCEIEEDHKK